MDVGFLGRLIALVERFPRLTELDYAEGGTQVRIARNPHGGASATEMVGRSPADPPPGSPTEGPATNVAATEVTATDAAEHTVSAGTPGTFFRAPGRPPFVAEGDRVREGQTLGLLEAMKVLNPVEADRDGRVLRILVEDGAAVAAGTPLLILSIGL